VGRIGEGTFGPVQGDPRPSRGATGRADHQDERRFELMKIPHLGHCVVAGALVLVVTLALGLPLRSLGALLVIAVCPVMMLVMMWSMNHDRGEQSDRTQTPAT
jgi:hypothetical protein